MTKPRSGVVRAILISNLVSIILFLLRALATSDTTFWFMLWNLILAWVPLALVWALLSEIKNKSWREPFPVLLTLGWLLFLPNSFYMVSDLLHLEPTGDINIIFDVVFFMSFIWNGLLAGFLSLRLVHEVLLARQKPRTAHYLIAGVLLANSFAIYLGRSLRWNSWDVLASPFAILFDVSERLINPLSYPQAFLTTTTFFMLLGSMYWVIYELMPLSPQKSATKEQKS